MTAQPDYSFNLFAIPYTTGAIFTLVFAIYAIRIPFRRTYHLLLAALTTAISVYFIDRAVGAAANSAVAYHPLSVLALYLFPLQLALAYHFLVSYTNVRPSRRLTYSVLCSYGVMLLFWGTLIFDEPLLIPGAVKTPLGLYADAPGPAEALILLYWSAVVAAASFLMVRFYRRLPPNIIRQQTRYLIIGAILANIGNLTLGLARDVAFPPVDWLLGPIGYGVVLLGFQKHGFAFVTASDETQATTTPRYSVPAGRSYLTVEHEAKSAFDTFADLVRHGHQGLCLTRSFPENVRRAYDLKLTPIRWLAESGKEDAIAPTDLLGLSMTVKSFLENGSNTVVLLDGVEYLVTNNGFKPILRLVQGLNDAVALSRGILLLPVEPKSLSEREEALLSSECIRLPLPKD